MNLQASANQGHRNKPGTYHRWAQRALKGVAKALEKKTTFTDRALPKHPDRAKEKGV